MKPAAWLQVALLVGAVAAVAVVCSTALGSGGTEEAYISASVTPASSVRCNRIRLPAQFYNDTTSPYNPAAMRHPSTGMWYLLHTFDEVSFTLSDTVRNGTNLAQLLNTHALLLKLPRLEKPGLQSGSHKELAMLEYDDRYLAAAQAAGSAFYKCGDWRPFAWRGGIYLAHWIYYARGEERMAISALDEEAGLVRLLHVLSPLPPAVAAARLAGRHAPVPKAESLSSVAGSTFAREKNWGLVEDGGELLLFYTLLPCTVVLAHDLSLGNATAVAATARTESRACFGGAAAAIARHTGLDMLRLPIHGSGNPVPWDTERGDGHREWLGMLHAKRGDYAHWAVRIDRATRRVTHVSAGPVVKARDYRNEGFLDSALVVGSFHVVDRVDEEGLQRVVRILYGEGDRFGCWLDVAADAIVWHALGDPDAGATLPAPAAAPPGADLAPARPHAPQLLPLGASDWTADMWAERGVMARLAGGDGAPGAGQSEAIADSAVRATARGRSSANARVRTLGRRGRDERRGGAETSR